MVLLLTAGGCSQYSDSLGLDVTPGVGIRDVITVDMSTSDVRWKNRGVLIEKYDRGRFWACIPSLGVSWEAESMKEKIRRIDFMVDPSRCSESSQLAQLHRFRGRIAGTLSLEAPKSLRREDIAHLFGEPAYSFELLSATNNFAEFRERIQQQTRRGKSVSLLTAPATEVLSYPSHGIGFALRSNVVYTMQAMKRVEQITKADGLKPAP